MENVTTYLDLVQSRSRRLRVTRSPFRGRERVDVRFYYEDSNGEHHPTREGVNIALRDLPALWAALDRALAEAVCYRMLEAEDFEAAGLPVPPELLEVA